MSEDVTRGEIEDIIRNFAAESPEYRQALIDNPAEVLARQMGAEVPAGVNVKVVEETADTIYLVAPYCAPAEGSELSDADLESVAGGKGSLKEQENNNTYTCNDNRGMGTRNEINLDLG
ncbi:MAG: NHLP leader peptide family RiPP precursor [Acidobacteriota bacterium]